MHNFPSSGPLHPTSYRDWQVLQTRTGRLLGTVGANSHDEASRKARRTYPGRGPLTVRKA